MWHSLFLPLPLSYNMATVTRVPPTATHRTAQNPKAPWIPLSWTSTTINPTRSFHESPLMYPYTGFWWLYWWLLCTSILCCWFVYVALFHIPTSSSSISGKKKRYRGVTRMYRTAHLCTWDTWEIKCCLEPSRNVKPVTTWQTPYSMCNTPTTSLCQSQMGFNATLSCPPHSPSRIRSLA